MANVPVKSKFIRVSIPKIDDNDISSDEDLDERIDKNIDKYAKRIEKAKLAKK